MSRRLFLVLLTTAITLALNFRPARADAPAAAGAVVRRLMEAIRTNDRAAYLAELAENYSYNGQSKSDFDPFGTLWVLSDHLLYRIAHLLPISPTMATALVDTNYTGRLNLEALGAGQPEVVGTSRLWIEVRRQADGQWRVSALRPVRLRFVHADTPSTFLEATSVNGASSIRVAPGSNLQVEGQSSFGITQLVSLGAASKQISLTFTTRERWNTELPAPEQPGRYYVDATSVILAPRPDGGFYISWDEVTIPVVVE